MNTGKTVFAQLMEFMPMSEFRDFFPKETDFNKVSLREIKRVQHLLNGRPRKVLDWHTPYEAFKELAGVALEC